MEQENKRLREKSEKWEDQAQKQKYKIQRMEENYTKMKGENQNLYEANKKLWTQIKDSKVGQFFGTNRREGESSQGQSNRWQQQAEEAQKKAKYWEGMHSSTSGKLEKCLERKRR